MLSLTKLREEVDIEKSRSRWDSPDHDKDLEICIRAKNNSWVIARTTQGKELYMVLENANETVLYASDAVEKFSNRCLTSYTSFVHVPKCGEGALKCFIFWSSME